MFPKRKKCKGFTPVDHKSNSFGTGKYLSGVEIKYDFSSRH